MRMIVFLTIAIVLTFAVHPIAGLAMVAWSVKDYADRKAALEACSTCGSTAGYEPIGQPRIATRYGRTKTVQRHQCSACGTRADLVPAKGPLWEVWPTVKTVRVRRD
jgi:hypothetical protein